MSLTWLDWLVMLLYFAAVIGVGISLRRSTTTSVEFFQAGRAIPASVPEYLRLRFDEKAHLGTEPR